MSSLDPAAGQIDLTTAVAGQRSPMLFDYKLALQTPALREMLAVWEDKRGARAMPCRADFSIRDLVKVLPQTGIVDLRREARGTRLFVRLSGSALDHFFAPLTGQYIDEAVSPYFAERWATIFMAPVKARAPVRGVSRTEFRDQLYLVGESVLLPLSEDGETASGVLYAVFHYSSNEVNARRAQVYAALVEEYERYCRDEVTSKA
jgi:hypothetical protein